MAGQLVGTRIREARRKMGLTQRQLAAEAGVSASYLNLIEHNKRRIAGVRLQALARALDMPAAVLNEGPDSAQLAELRAVATAQSGMDPTQIEVFIAQFPGWAQSVAALSRQNHDLREAITVLSDRLSHDPFLAETLHSVLSNITAIRSAAGILSTVDDIAPDQQRRFVRSIHDESRRLSNAATALSAYLDRASEGAAAAATPEEAVDRFMLRHGYRFAALDAGGTIASLLADAPELDSQAAHAMAHDLLARYASDAAALPLEAFAKSAAQLFYNPHALGQHFGSSQIRVYRRLATLRRDGIAAPRFGLLVVNAAGQPVWRQPLESFALPRHGAACALWPIFQAFSTPDRSSVAALSLTDGTAITALSLAEQTATAPVGQAPNYQAAMLLIPDESLEAIAPWFPRPQGMSKVGTACAICTRTDCAARSRAAYLTEIPQTAG
ncbi:MAG: short-chain fatty acyl-CoA regulator family protein [Paracoccaceae bacterium]